MYIFWSSMSLNNLQKGSANAGAIKCYTQNVNMIFALPADIKNINWHYLDALIIFGVSILLRGDLNPDGFFLQVLKGD